MTTFFKYLQYFLIAALTTALSWDSQPQDAWGWWRLLGSASLQGIVAMKALQSNTAADPTDAKPHPEEIL